MANDPLENLPLELARYRILDVKQTADFLGLSAVSVKRFSADGTIPKPLRLSPGRLGWKLGDLIDWIETRPRED